MKRNFLLICILLVPFTIKAQNVDDDIDLIQEIFGLEKRKLVNEYMNISEQQAAGFWSVYNKYESERKELSQKRLLLINEYSNNYLNLTDDKANQLAKELLDNNVKYEKLHKQYFPKFKKVSSPIKAAQFMQLETYLQNSIRSELQDNIPLIGQVEKLKK